MARPNRQQLEARAKALRDEIDAKQKEAARIRTELSKKKRAEDRDRKILVGAFYLGRAGHDERFQAQMLKDLGSYLKREDQRALFGLPPLPEPSPSRVGEDADKASVASGEDVAIPEASTVVAVEKNPEQAVH